MTLPATILRVVGALGVLCTVLAAATLWVVFTEPITVARIAVDGDLSLLLQIVTDALGTVFRVAVSYL